MSASGGVLKAAVLDLGGVVRVTGTGAVLQVVVVTGAGVFVADDRRNGCAAGEAVQNAAEEFGTVLFFPRD